MIPPQLKETACALSVFLATLTFGLLAGCILHADERPNVLLITADDLGIQLSCYDDPIAKTPNLDALALSGVQFKTAYVSQASCSPSRSTMFTGMYPHGNGQYGLLNAGVGFRVHQELVDQLLPNVLGRHGYRTGIIGKLHVGPEAEFKFDLRTSDGFGSRQVEKQVALAKAFMTRANAEPWFLMFNVFDPHVARLSGQDGKRGPQYFPDQVEGLPQVLLGPQDIAPWPWQQIDTPAQREKIAGYYNCVHRVDAAIGLLMKELEASGQASNTLIILLGDHGPPFARGKTSCYEAGLRVPFLVRWPGVSQPHVSERLVSSVDIYPTILDAVGANVPAGIHGRSLRPIMASNDESVIVAWRQTLAAEFHFHGASPFFPRRAIRDGRYKLIHNLRAGTLRASNSVDGDDAYQVVQELPPDALPRVAMQRLADPPEWELYDLQTDPIEFQNRADDPALASVRASLEEALSQWQAETLDPFREPAFRDSVEQKYRAK